MHYPSHPPSDAVPSEIIARIRELGRLHGFGQVGFSSGVADDDNAHLTDWLAAGYQGEMDWMARHAALRQAPGALVEGTRTIISVRMDYWPADATDPAQVLIDGTRGYVSRYATGRDYHKLIRQRLQHLADDIGKIIGPFGYRVFCDSAPVLEKAHARNAALGWIGKHTNLIHRQAGSWFFLGEIYTDLALPPDPPVTQEHCGTCTRCIDVCPTRAIVAPYQLDARLCISYLTIELKGGIPVELRPLIGNRIYGCDDCQLVCPWNRFARVSAEPDFRVRNSLDNPDLVALFAWTEDEFLTRTEGSAIRRIGWLRWLRNIAVALGNAPHSQRVHDALMSRVKFPDSMVREHVEWALQQQAMT
ncbi:MAG: tRNA epoxyqueuosine(34) reductase QueG [Gammaproteobacteria bacterium]|nr:tRNA epoxyqueuosine(34) reductase QueG [Gammaproteobacteria bacterium]